ncbi:hypothetical protein [Dyella sp. AD56]|nr:hypothetical protein [Dyella sp. AD56]
MELRALLVAMVSIDLPTTALASTVRYTLGSPSRTGAPGQPIHADFRATT